MDLTVVIVTWNTRELVLGCLASVFAELRGGAGRAPVAARVRVVDNGSSDGTAEAVAQRFPDAERIRLASNVGFAAGCNHGLRGRSGGFALLLNSDARLQPGALGRCLDFLRAHPDVGLVGPRLVGSDGRVQNSIHNYPTLVQEIVPRSLLRFALRRRHPSKRWVGDAPTDVEAVIGAALFVREAVLRDVGLVPEDTFFYLEDTEWCRRARAAGWRVVHLPTASVTHLSGASSKRRDPAPTRIEYHRSLYRWFRAHRGAAALAAVVAMRSMKSLLYTVTQAPLAVAGGRARRRWAAHRDVLLWHLRGCPEAAGLAGLRAPEPAPLPSAR